MTTPTHPLASLDAWAATAEDARAAARAAVAAAELVDVVRVHPFLVATKPVTLRELGAKLGQRVDRSWVAQLAERVPFAELWNRSLPAIVPGMRSPMWSARSRKARGSLVTRSGSTFARDGGTGIWVAAPDDTRESALGLRGFGAPAWVEGGSGARGGGWDTHPWQDGAERLTRPPGRGRIPGSSPVAG